MKGYRYSTIIVLIAWCIWSIDGRGIDLGFCGNDNIPCQCGEPGYTIYIPVKLCTFFYRSKPYCKACDESTKEGVCDKYRRCQDCVQGAPRCTSCPANRFGDWCTGECLCKNGGSCNQYDGKCNCLEGYTGTNCEHKTGCTAPVTTFPLISRMIPTESNPILIDYLCAEGYKLIGSPHLSCLFHQQWSTPPPQCVKDCPPLPKVISNGHRTQMVTGVPFTMFRCDDGFSLIGQEVIYCLDNGTWSSSIPKCERKTVTVPNLNVYADCNTEASAIISENRDIEVSLECPPGCGRRGGPVWGVAIYYEKSAVCRAAIHAGIINDTGGVVIVVNIGFYQPFSSNTMNGITSEIVEVAGRGFIFRRNKEANQVKPSLDRAITHCSDPGLAGSGLTQDDFAVGKSITYNSCPEGLKLTGPSVVKCLEDGNWSSSFPVCVRDVSHCSDPGSPDFGFLDVQDGFAVGKSVKYICQEGYKLMGSSVLTCLEDGKWSSTIPVCVTEIKAHEPANEVRVLDCTTVGSHILDGAASNVTVVCPSGCALYLNSTVFGTIFYAETSSVCRAALHAGIITDEGGGIVVVSQGTQDHYFGSVMNSIVSSELILTDEESNSTKAFSFDDFQDSGNETIDAADGEKRCEDLGPLQNGKFEFDTEVEPFTADSTIFYTCDPTHHLRGESLLTCTGNWTWDFLKPRCVAVMCPDLPEVEHGKLEYLSNPTGRRPATLTRKGFPGGRISLRNPMNPPPNINQLTQDMAYVDGVTKLITIPEGYHAIGTKVIYKCESQFYKLTGYKSRMCMYDGQWSGRDTGRLCIPVCGQSGDPKKPLISNGNTTKIGQWPWHVAIADQAGVFCGGSLLNDKWVLTAAHCLLVESTTVPYPVEYFRVLAGKYYFDRYKDDELVQERQVKALYVHPDYEPKIFDSDIALMELQEPVRLSSRVQPVCLPTSRTTKNNVVDGRTGMVTGWGKQNPGNESFAAVLQEAEMPAISVQRCYDTYKSLGYTLTITERMFCAGYEELSIATCVGDSGGPFVFLDDKDRRWVLEGIVSWGFDECGTPKKYTGITRVQKFSKWISQFI